MTKLIKIIFLSSLVSLIYNTTYGQDHSQYEQNNSTGAQEYSGFYRNYPTPKDKAIEIPNGYSAFYISHYGRHGSRWISEKEIYDRTESLMDNAKKENALTEKGNRLYQSLKSIIHEAKGMEGELSAQGVREHRAIAERMYKNYPEVFYKGASIDSRATQYSRCILSMCAFDERLKELNTSLQISRKASKKDLHYMSFYGHTEDSWKKSIQVSDSLAQQWIKPERFIDSIFSKEDFILNIDKPYLAMADIFHLACSQQATEGKYNLFEYFTEYELAMLGKVLSTQTYIEEGPSTRFGDCNLANAKNLLKNIVETADKVISGEIHDVATLRFGHESNIVPLLCLIRADKTDMRQKVEKIYRTDKSTKTRLWSEELELAAREWNITQICPMATNLQLVFLKNSEGNIKVLILHNERKVQLPLEGAPFYDWSILRNYLNSLCA